MADHERLAKETTIMRAAHQRRLDEVENIIQTANPEAGGMDVIVRLLAGIYVRGL